MRKLIIVIIVAIGAYALTANGAAKTVKPVETAIKARQALLSSI